MNPFYLIYQPFYFTVPFISQLLLFLLVPTALRTLGCHLTLPMLGIPKFWHFQYWEFPDSDTSNIGNSQILILPILGIPCFRHLQYWEFLNSFPEFLAPGPGSLLLSFPLSQREGTNGGQCPQHFPSSQICPLVNGEGLQGGDRLGTLSPAHPKLVPLGWEWDKPGMVSPTLPHVPNLSLG